MQTVKNLYGQYDGTAIWKAGEIVLATRLDKLCSKDEILSLYVNIINYGNNYHGIEQAAMGYYGVTPDQLTDSQATMLAGIPQSPSAFNPILHYDAARRKQRTVLDAMVRNKMISQEESDAIFAQECYPIGIASPQSQIDDLDQSIIEQIQDNPRLIELLDSPGSTYYRPLELPLEYEEREFFLYARKAGSACDEKVTADPARSVLVDWIRNQKIDPAITPANSLDPVFV